MTSARLIGIARHDRPHGPMQTIDHVGVTCAEGVHGDFRGALKPGRNKRQVTVMRAEDWLAAVEQVGLPVEWQERRVNLLVRGLIEWPPRPGEIMRIGATLELRINGECDPCARMDALVDGLQLALRPDWRGGIITTVIADGDIALGDDVSVHVEAMTGSKA
ncbi:MOSC domain-containing protein YiiM [Sphingomonas zeicaulis]|uniref:MOSC domain-containing protein n=1 Tax=Sphingomonas zeicaulis TaxID=1632740 RepID=UPI003D194B83